MAVSILHAGLPFPVRNARYTVLVPNLNATGVPTDPVTPACTVSIDTAAGVASAETPTIIATFGGGTVMTFSATEMNCTALFPKFTEASGPGPTLLPIYPRILPIVQSGTASGGAVGSITLALTAASYSLVGAFVRTTGGTGGGGALNQCREITAYDTSTKIATVVPNFETAPDATTTYDILDPTQGNRFKPAVNPLWEGSITTISATQVTLPANHNIDTNAQLAIILKSGTNAVGRQRYMTFASGSLWNVDPVWNAGSEPTPSAGPFTAEVYSVAKAPTTNLPNVNAYQVGGLTVPSGAIPNATAGNAGGLFIAGANASTSVLTALTANITGNLSGTVGGSTLTAGIKKNAALASFPFIMTDSTTHLPKTGVTVTAQRSLDGGAYGACANAVVELSAGSYTINLAAGDLNANTVMLKFTGTGCDTQFNVIATGGP